MCIFIYIYIYVKLFKPFLSIKTFVLLFPFSFQCADHTYKRKHLRLQKTKKFDCPAQVILKEYVEFPDYTVTNI